MPQNIEIELKNILTKQEFEKLSQFFNITPHDFFTQENHYFDTVNFALKEKGCALRIRQKNNHFELTLKQPHQDGLLETNEILPIIEVEQMLKGETLKNTPLRSIIKKINIDPDTIQYFGTLTTKRAEITYKHGLIVLDHSYYLNKEDYELEYEVTNREAGEIIFSTLLTQLNIPIRKTNNKIKRFYDEKYKESRGD